MKNSILTAFFLFALSLCSFGQNTMASPRDSASGQVGDAVVSVNYGSPSVKGRKIWGRLVPYGKVWRTGANEATTFTTSKDLLVEGKPLAAGSYGLFTIPGENEWVVVLNKVARQWGAFEYNDKEDALRVNVKPVSADSTSERLKFTFEKDTLFMSWEKLRLPVALSRAA